MSAIMFVLLNVCRTSLAVIVSAHLYILIAASVKSKASYFMYGINISGFLECHPIFQEAVVEKKETQTNWVS